MVAGLFSTSGILPQIDLTPSRIVLGLTSVGFARRWPTGVLVVYLKDSLHPAGLLDCYQFVVAFLRKNKPIINQGGSYGIYTLLEKK